MDLPEPAGPEVAEPLDFPVRWDTGAPMPHLLVGTAHAYLVFYLPLDYPDWDGTNPRGRKPETDPAEPIAVVEFHGCVSAKLGAPNDEVFSGHPLWGKGLEPYSAQVVRNSRWIAELEAINKVHPQYQPEFWDSLNHYVFWFHDETFECVAKSYEVEVLASTLPDVLETVARRLLA